MLAAFNGNSVFEGPRPPFYHPFGLLFGPFGPQRAHWGVLLGAPWGGQAGQSRVGRRGPRKRVMRNTATRISASQKVI